MTETEKQRPDPGVPVPHDDDLDVEGPNESGQPSQPEGDSPLSDQDES